VHNSVLVQSIEDHVNVRFGGFSGEVGERKISRREQEHVKLSLGPFEPLVDHLDHLFNPLHDSDDQKSSKDGANPPTGPKSPTQGGSQTSVDSSVLQNQR